MNTRSLLPMFRFQLLCVVLPSLVAARSAMAQPAAVEATAEQAPQDAEAIVDEQHEADGAERDDIALDADETSGIYEPPPPSRKESRKTRREARKEAREARKEARIAAREARKEEREEQREAHEDTRKSRAEEREEAREARKAAREARKEARAQQRAERGERHVPIRGGAGFVMGGTLPDAAPVLGFALRGGMQHGRCAFMLEGGLAGALGGALKSGDVHSSRSTVFYHGYLAPTVELGVDRLFLSLGVPVGIGMWSTAGNTVDELGTVRSEARSTPALITFVAGLEGRVGRHFNVHGRHHVTVALGAKLLFARQDESTTTVQLEGAISGSHERTIGVRFLPTLNVGYDFF